MTLSSTGHLYFTIFNGFSVIVNKLSESHNSLFFLTLSSFWDIFLIMQCSECSYISFKIEKTCGFCGFRFKKSQNGLSLSTKESFSIFSAPPVKEGQKNKENNVEIFRVTSGERKTKNATKLLNDAIINIENQNFVKNRKSCDYCEFNNTEFCKR